MPARHKNCWKTYKSFRTFKNVSYHQNNTHLFCLVVIHHFSPYNPGNHTPHSRKCKWHRTSGIHCCFWRYPHAHIFRRRYHETNRISSRRKALTIMSDPNSKEKPTWTTEDTRVLRVFQNITVHQKPSETTQRDSHQRLHFWKLHQRRHHREQPAYCALWSQKFDLSLHRCRSN